jgi:outer membrane lipoprotein-sorting protein
MLLAATLFSVAAADADWGVAELMHRLAQVKKASASFAERKYLRILTEPLESSGTLLYTAPSRLEKNTLLPIEESMMLDHDKVTLEDKAKRQRRTFDLRAQPALRPFVESIRATLAGDLPTLQRYYKIALDGEPDRWRLVLTPSESRMRAAVSEIRIAGSGTWVGSIEIIEPTGDRTVMTISETQP